MASIQHDVFTGVLTDEGVVCQAMRGDDGELYTLRDLPDALDAGDRVVIDTGGQPWSPISVCDQGRHLEWVSVTLLAPNGEAQRTWKKGD